MHTAYPAHTQGKSNAGIYKASVIDRICAIIVLGGCIVSMTALVAYSNHRDAEYFKNHHTVASFPSRPEECNLDCPPMDYNS